MRLKFRKLITAIIDEDVEQLELFKIAIGVVKRHRFFGKQFGHVLKSKVYTMKSTNCILKYIHKSNLNTQPHKDIAHECSVQPSS